MVMKWPPQETSNPGSHEKYMTLFTLGINAVVHSLLNGFRTLLSETFGRIKHYNCLLSIYYKISALKVPTTTGSV